MAFLVVVPSRLYYLFRTRSLDSTARLLLYRLPPTSVRPFAPERQNDERQKDEKETSKSLGREDGNAARIDCTRRAFPYFPSAFFTSKMKRLKAVYLLEEPTSVFPLRA